MAVEPARWLLDSRAPQAICCQRHQLRPAGPPHPRQRRAHCELTTSKEKLVPTDPKSAPIRYIGAARDGMSAVIRDSFAPDATWEYPGDLPLSGTYRGVDEIVGTFLGGAAKLMAPGP